MSRPLLALVFGCWCKNISFNQETLFAVIDVISVEWVSMSVSVLQTIVAHINPLSGCNETLDIASPSKPGNCTCMHMIHMQTSSHLSLSLSLFLALWIYIYIYIMHICICRQERLRLEAAIAGHLSYIQITHIAELRSNIIVLTIFVTIEQFWDIFRIRIKQHARN